MSRKKRKRINHKRQNRISNILEIIEKIIIGLNLLSAIGSIVGMMVIYYDKGIEDEIKTVQIWFSILAIALIFLGWGYSQINGRFITRRIVKEFNGISPEIRKAILKEIKFNPFITFLQPKKVNNTIDTRRTNIRIILNICLVGLVLLMMYITIYYADLLVFIGVTCCFVIIYIYVDYGLHANNYAKKYDKQFENAKKGSAIRGLARIYMQEYRATKFGRNNNLYKNLQQPQSVECMKHIIRMEVDKKFNPGLVFSGVMLIINVMLINEKFQNYLMDIVNYFQFPKGSFLYNVMLVIIFEVTFLFNVLQIVNDKLNTEQLSTLAIYTYLNDKKMVKQYFSQYDFSELVIVRGKFQYCSEWINQERDLDKVSLSDKMLFIHKAVANVPRLKMTITLIGIASMSFLLHFVGWKMWMVLMIPVYIGTYVILKKYWLPKLGKKKIADACNILQNI